MKGRTFLNRVILKNYKSIGACDVELGPLTFLVGPNGSGKSNFLDSLRFVAVALRNSLDHALRERGGIGDVRRRSRGHPRHFSIRLEFTLPAGDAGSYSFRIGARPAGGFEVQEEECLIQSIVPAAFRVQQGVVESRSDYPMPPASMDRLYLVNVSGLPQFRPVYDTLNRMGFYNLNPDEIRELQSPDPGDLLAPDGSNIASVLAQLEKHRPDVKLRIEEYLAKVVPGISGVTSKIVGPKETLEFRQKVAGDESPWNFLAASMSDGTLRALGVLVSLFQSSNGSTTAVPLVGIEEPESALHPGAAGVLRDSLREASRIRQVLVTSHSPDLLDDDLAPESILTVDAKDGVTQIGPMDDASRSALRERIYTAGELLRHGQLTPQTDGAQISDAEEETDPQGLLRF